MASRQDDDDDAAAKSGTCTPPLLTTQKDNDAEDDESNNIYQQQFRIYYNDVYEVPLPPNHRFPMEKYRLVRERVQQTLMAEQQPQPQPPQSTLTTTAPVVVDLVVSPLATPEELRTTHDGAYIQRFLEGKMTEQELRNVGFPWSPEGVDRALSSVGGTVAAACFVCEQEEIQRRRQQQQQQNSSSSSNNPLAFSARRHQDYGRSAWAAHVAGGTHHAFHDFGEGFSVFSDIAVAANVVLQRYPSVVGRGRGRGRILIIDLDVHQGNGNAVLFQNQEQVFTFSMHCAGNYFSAKQDSDLDIELPIGCHDSTYLMTLHHWLQNFQQQHHAGNFHVDLIFFQAGVDILKSDRLGRMDLSPAGVRRRNELVYNFADNLQVPLVVTMGGGYPNKIGADGKGEGWDEIVDAHASVYIQAYQHLEGQQSAQS